MYISILIGVAAVGLAVVFGSEASDYPMASRRLPILLAWLIGALTLLMLLEDVMKWRSRARSGGADEGAGHSIAWSALLPFAATIGVFVVLVPLIGFIVVTPLFVAGVLLVSRAVSPVVAIAYAAGLTAFVWAVFIWALRMPIPLLPAWL
jgi:putative tricarboxylic transport membrane protein